MTIKKDVHVERACRYPDLVICPELPQPAFQQHTDELARLISGHQALIIGPIRQEILSGYSDAGQFALLRDKLAYFENTPILDLITNWLRNFPTGAA